MAERPPVCDFGWKAPRFTLPGVDGETCGLEELKGPNGTVVVFICNHCPYVKSVIGRIVETAGRLSAEGIGFAPTDEDAECAIGAPGKILGLKSH